MPEKIRLIVLAVVEEEKSTKEDFGRFISRIRSKYADAIGTEEITLKALKGD
jgi:hypothetical protein